MEMASLHRQRRRPLPLGFPYHGHWILEPRVFLFRSEDRPADISEAPQFAVQLNPCGEEWSFGFDALMLATDLGVNEDELFFANEAGNLTLERIEADTPDGVGHTAKRYSFALGGQRTTIITRYPEVVVGPGRLKRQRTGGAKNLRQRRLK